MNWKSEILALAFGGLVVCEIFGDQWFFQGVGNLDAIFGTTNGSYRIMDLFYPLASLGVFLLYARSKGPIPINLVSAVLLAVFLIALVVMQFDDLFVAFYHRITLPSAYWAFARVFYFAVSISTFFLFGALCGKKGRLSN
jgi:hypothetical protein